VLGLERPRDPKLRARLQGCAWHEPEKVCHGLEAVALAEGHSAVALGAIRIW